MIERYHSLQNILANYIERTNTLFVGSPNLNRDYKPHKQVMAVGVLFKTPATFYMLDLLWDNTICRLIISLLEGEEEEIITTLDNERLFIYTEEQILTKIKELPGEKNHLILYLDSLYEDYREKLIIIDKVRI